MIKIAVSLCAFQIGKHKQEVVMFVLSYSCGVLQVFKE